MSLEDIKYVLELLGTLGVGAILGGLIVLFIIKSFIPGYLSKKGENLATKEDIEEITRKIEAIKSQYDFLLEDRRARHLLRLAAIDKRLQAHQEAFSLWREVFKNIHEKGITDTVVKCQTWWDENCIYLEPEVRKEFSNVIYAANDHASLLKDRGNQQLVKDNWRIITGFPNKLFSHIELPPLSETEERNLSLNAER